MLWLPWWMVDRILLACDIAEERIGRPVTGVEIFAVFSENNMNDFTMPVNDVYTVAAVIMSMLREHKLYTEPLAYYFTTKPKEGYHTFQYLFDQKYGPGYTLGHNQEVVPCGDTKSLNFNELWGILRSTDAEQLNKNRWMFDGSFRFLDGSVPMAGQKVAYCTYPRSGNSYLRRVLEQCTGISTGATISLHTATTLQI